MESVDDFYLLDWLDEEDAAIEAEMDGPFYGRRTYQLPARASIDTWDDFEFVVRFRMSKSTVQRILKLIEPTLRHPQPRSRYVTPEQQLLITLRFLACGSMQLVVADVVHVSQATVSRILRKVCEALLMRFDTFIKMPETNAERVQAAADFYRFAEFPRTIGAIDCTHVKIQSPGGPLVSYFQVECVCVFAFTDLSFLFILWRTGRGLPQPKGLLLAECANDLVG